MKLRPIEDATSYGILDCFRNLVSLVHTTSRASEKKLGLSAAQIYVLKETLRSGTALSINELALLTRTHQSSVSAVVKKLLDKKLMVSKASEEDARRLELRLTAKGKKIAESSPESLQDSLLRSIGRLNQAEGETLKKLLERVLEQSAKKKEPTRLFLEDPSE